MYKTRREIENWLKEMDIQNYTIKDNLTVDVNDDVDISIRDLKYIPIQFGLINGSFNCSYNQLTNLEGCPKIVNGSFRASSNKISDIDYFPDFVKNHISISNNKIKDLSRLSLLKNIESLDCSHNNIKSIKCLKSFKKLDCSYNEITSLEGCPREVYGEFNCSHNRLTSIEYFPQKVHEYRKINHIVENATFDCSYNNILNFNDLNIDCRYSVNLSNNNANTMKYIKLNCIILISDNNDMNECDIITFQFDVLSLFYALFDFNKKHSSDKERLMSVFFDTYRNYNNINNENEELLQLNVSNKNKLKRKI